MLPLSIVLCALGASGFVQQSTDPNQKKSEPNVANMDKVFQDETHCLTSPEIRSDKDSPISCFCRDAIADARYVYTSYLTSWKDRNLNGVFLVLQPHAAETCGKDIDVIMDETMGDRLEMEWARGCPHLSVR